MTPIVDTLPTLHAARVVPSPPFGDRYAVEDVLPASRAIVVGWREHGGPFQPRRILLPHQLYVERVQEWADAGARDICVARFVAPWIEVL